jgi:hypothetical protein
VTTEGRELLDQLLTEDLSGITFVRDYLQLQLNPPPTINVYTKCSVHIGTRSASFGEEAFANIMLAQIGKAVSAVSAEDETFTITFADGSWIEIPFGERALEGPEAFVFSGRDNRWGVWPR